MLNKVIIDFTPTGMIPTKEMSKKVPISVLEIIEDVRLANEIGITKVHLHARDESTGKPSYKKEIYEDIIRGIREFAPSLVICVSLSGRDFSDLKFRSDPLFLKNKLKPDMASLTLSSLNFNRVASVNSPDMIQSLAAIMKEKNIVPELEVFDNGMINYGKYLEKKGFIEAPFYFNLLLGNIATAQANILDVGMMINSLPEKSLWSLAGLGQTQLQMNSLSIAIGGGVRVGLEDNIWYDYEKAKLASNIDLLKRVHELASVNSREIMTSLEFRQLMNLELGDIKFGRKVQ